VRAGCLHDCRQDAGATQFGFPTQTQSNVLSLASWQRPGLRDSSECWSASIPLRPGGKSRADLEIRRGLAKDRLLFQFSSLLDTLIPSFEKQLKLRYELAGLSRDPAAVTEPALSAAKDRRYRPQARAATGNK